MQGDYVVLQGADAAPQVVDLLVLGGQHVGEAGGLLLALRLQPGQCATQRHRLKAVPLRARARASRQYPAPQRLSMLISGLHQYCTCKFALTESTSLLRAM